MIRWLDHTADAAVEIVCEKKEDVFHEFVTVLTTLLSEAKVRPVEKRDITVEASDLATVLVALGREILYAFYTEDFVPHHMEIRFLSSSRLEGEIWGETVASKEDVINQEVKGVTYHDLEFRQLEKGKWRARVTFDV